MDMWKAFRKSTLKEGHAPQARIVYDKFRFFRFKVRGLGFLTIFS